MKLDIRKARRGDLGLLVQLLAEMDGERPPQPGRALSIWSEMSRYPGYYAYLAFDGNMAVGTFTLLVFPSLVHGGTREALVDGVVVTASRRGKGVGTAMLREAMRIAVESGCYKLALSSSLKREEAHRFYRALGFREHGVSFHADTGQAAQARGPVEGLIPVPD